MAGQGEQRIRVATVIVGTRKFEGFRIAFSIKRSLESAANSADLAIWGLNETSRAELEGKRKIPVAIDAGYEGGRGLIFSGEAVNPSSQRESGGWVTKCQALDGHTAQRAIVSQTLGPRTTPAQAIQAVASAMGLSTRGLQGDLSGQIGAFQSGVTLTGSAKTVLDRLSKSAGLDWSIQDGELVMLAPLQVRPGEAVLVSPQTGLLGSPVLGIDEAHPGRKVARFEVLLNPRLAPGVKVALRSLAVDGVFKVGSVNHSGDTYGTTWRTSVEAVELTGLVSA